MSFLIVTSEQPNSLLRSVTFTLPFYVLPWQPPRNYPLNKSVYTFYINCQAYRQLLFENICYLILTLLCPNCVAIVVKIGTN